MTISAICTRDVIAAYRTDSVTDAARMMRKFHVGSLVIIEDNAQGGKVPVGIITDRDITISVTALGLDPAAITVNEIMADAVVCVHENAGIAESVALMRTKGVRRLPVVNDLGALTGIIAADDLLSLLADELSGLADSAARERRHEQENRRSGV